MQQTFRWLDVDVDTILLTLTGGKPWHQQVCHEGRPRSCLRVL